MKICFICKKDGQRRPRWVNMNIYRQYRRDSFYSILYKFDEDTFQMCCDSIAIRKVNGLLFGDLVLNKENRNKYGFHMECYRNLVSIKRKHLRKWQVATYKCVSYVYIDPDLENESLETQHDKTNQTNPNKVKAKSKIRKEKKLVKKKRNRKSANKSIEFLTYGETCDNPEPTNIPQFPSDVKDDLPQITVVTVAKEQQSTNSFNTTNVSINEKINQCGTETNQKPETPVLINSSQPLRPKRKGLNSASRRKFKCLLECNIPPEEAKDLARRHWADLVKLGYIPNLKPKAAQQGDLETDQIQPAPVLRKPTQFRFRKYFYMGICNIRPMLQEQIKKVHHALENAIDMEHKGIAPTITKFIYRPGWLVVTYVDDYSRQWLVKKVPEIKPWPDAKLSTVNDKQVPKATTASVFVNKKEDRSVAAVLKQLKTQNYGLNTEYWMVISERDVGTGRVIVLSLDTPSVDFLKKARCKARLGFRTINFNIKVY